MKYFIIDVKEKYQYQFIVLISNKPYSEKFNYLTYLDSFKFKLEQENKDKKYNKLVYIKEEDREDFVEMCNSHGIVINFYDDLIVEYERYKDMQINEKDTLLSEEYYEVDIEEVIAEENVAPIICGEGTSKTLLEETIEKTAKLKIWIGSNERTGHHLPHIHADYENEKYAVFNLVDLTVIESKAKQGLNAKTKELKELIIKNIIKARTGWNKTNALLKFPTITKEIPYTPQLIKEQ